MKEILRFDQVTKRFPGVLALDKVSFSLNEGEILGLCGENGAGKSTLLKILAGVYHDYEGQILIDGQPVRFQVPKEAIDAGVSVIYQEMSVLQDLTVAENIFLGKWPKKHNLVDYAAMNSAAEAVLSSLQVNLLPTTPMRELTVAQTQIVEIAKAITNDCRILVMDEPTSALSEMEIESLLGLVTDLRNKRNLAIIYVSHKLNEIFSICDSVQVIRDGRTISHHPTADVTRDMLIRDMVGREMQNIFPKMQTAPEDLVAFETVGLSGKYVHDVSLKVRKGEIVAVYGLMGSGTVELADTIFGVNKVHSGQILVNGDAVSIKNPTDSVKNGIAYLTSDRKGTGLILQQMVSENISTSSLKKWANRFGVLKSKQEDANAEHWRERMNIKTPSIHQLVQNLSGGNQQKVVISKWLSTDCKILIFCDPTRGIDINAKYEIYKILKELCIEGYSILLISHEIPEVMGIADRIYVIKDGALTAELTPDAFDQNRILEYAIGKD